MTGFRLMTEEEIAAAADNPFEKHLHPDPAKYRYHCGTCGRYVPFATVQVIPHWEYGYGSEQTTLGVCKTHGEVDVTWGQQ
jgi:hypothetical protein